MVSKTVGGGPLGLGVTGGTSRLLVRIGTTGVLASLTGVTGPVVEDEVGRLPNKPLLLLVGEATPLRLGLSNGLPVLLASGLVGLGDDFGLLGSPGAGARGLIGAGASG